MEKYNQNPLQELGFALVHFQELPSTVFGPDGHCICTKNQACLNVDKRCGNRCSLTELLKLDREAAMRRSYQSGE
jgi:hypothetical protein